MDATLYLNKPLEIWADLAPHLVHRKILVEHFSNSVSTADFMSCQEKIAHASKVFESTALKHRGEERSPSMVILSHRKPEKLLSYPDFFESTDTPGIWVRKPLDLACIFLVSTTRLPEDERYDWLRMSTRVPERKQEFDRANALIERVNLDNLTKERVQEAMMDMTIDGRHPIEFKNEFKSLKRSYRALEQELEEYRRRAEEAKVQAESLLKKNEETVQQLVKEVGALRQELEKMKSQENL
ncbi:hypothetical protein FRD01_16630 [Microvenator marinus]|uniref:Uncharacterized protein n=1 Tax=Microvenator marinus TaxID=2600177 RepID=A0A5B8XTF1_9DELT|nr:hypothetical protein [Microvenator marinus]QED28835.1 hypothetical protein FRD01_16630 [Microvenator marinus]